jgi:hypothetical protein
MVVGSVGTGVLAGLTAAVAAVLTGTPWWGALGIYTIVSSLSFVACGLLMAVREWHREAGPHRPHGAAYPGE